MPFVVGVGRRGRVTRFFIIVLRIRNDIDVVGGIPSIRIVDLTHSLEEESFSCLEISHTQSGLLIPVVSSYLLVVSVPSDGWISVVAWEISPLSWSLLFEQARTQLGAPF